jgi:antitoxin ParD1/3/4/toxin ParE1/3/4
MYKLATTPGMGHVREDLVDRRHRCWPVYSHLVNYRPDTLPLQIIRVVSGYRDIPCLFCWFRRLAQADCLRPVLTT